MQRIHRSRSFAPALNPLEGRLLLSVAPGKAAIDLRPLSVPDVSQATLTDQNIFNNYHVLTSVELTATVKPLFSFVTLVPTGTVTLSILKKESHGTFGTKTMLGNFTLSGGSASVTVPAKRVLEMPVAILYTGDSNFTGSMSTPEVVTKAGLKPL